MKMGVAAAVGVSPDKKPKRRKAVMGLCAETEKAPPTGGAFFTPVLGVVQHNQIANYTSNRPFYSAACAALISRFS